MPGKTQPGIDTYKPIAQQMSSELLDLPSNDRFEAFTQSHVVHDFVDDLPIGVYRALPHGKLLSANKTLLNIFKADSLEELNETLATSSFQLLCQRQEFLAQLDSTGEIKGFESESALPDGRRFLTRESVRTLRDESGQILFFDGTLEEVQATTKTSLLDGAHLLNALMESTPDTIYFKDSSSRFIRVNKSQATILGLDSPEQAVGKTDFDFFTGAHAKDAFDDEQRLMETRIPVIDKMEQIRRADGDFRWVSATKVPMINSDNEVIGIAGISRDITDRKTAELERHVLFRLMQDVSLSDKLSDQLQLVHQAVGEVIYAKNFYVALLDEASGMLHFEFYVDEHDQMPPPQPATEGLTGFLLKKNSPLLLTAKQQHQLMASGELAVKGSVSASWLGVPLRTSNATIGALVVQSYVDSRAYSQQDVEFLTSVGSQVAMTIQKKMAQDRLEKTAAMLSQSNRELQDFASVASHDLQEPLRKIQAFGDRLKTKCEDQLNEDGKDYLARMQNAANRMQTLINDLLTFSRVTTKAQPFSKVDLEVVVRDVLSDLEVRIEQTGGTVEVSNLPVIDADRLQMRQLFQNLIANALKFRKPNEAAVVRISSLSESSHEVEGASWLLTTPDVVEISISDNGIGFDEKYLDRIFTVFQRLHGRNAYEGTGVGLAVCRRIVERHGGTITAQSKPDCGATFIIKLPVNQRKGATQ